MIRSSRQRAYVISNSGSALATVEDISGSRKSAQTNLDDTDAEANRQIRGNAWPLARIDADGENELRTRLNKYGNYCFCCYKFFRRLLAMPMGMTMLIIDVAVVIVITSST